MLCRWGTERRVCAPLPIALGLLVSTLTGCTTAAAPVTARLTAGLVQTRVAAPAVAGRTLSGQQQRLADLTPNVVVVNFYASWCEPCRTEAPFLARLAQQNAAAGVTVVGVLENDSASHGRAFAKRYGLPYPTLTDPGAAILRSFRIVDVGGIPVTVALDRTGRVAGRWLGPLTAHPDFRSAIAALAAEPRP